MVTVPCDTPPRNISYPVTAVLSVDAVQLNVKLVEVTLDDDKPDGTVGAWVSAVVAVLYVSSDSCIKLPLPLAVISNL